MINISLSFFFPLIFIYISYLVIYRDGKSKSIRNPSEFPEADEMSYNVSELQEPMVMATIILPNVGIIIIFS